MSSAPWFAWVLIGYFWANIFVGVSRIDEPVTYTRGAAALYIFITAFMTWAALTQIG